MRLNDIYYKIALKALGKPGTVVEYMEDCDGPLEKGKLYTVEKISNNGFLQIEGLWWLAMSFRKCIEK